MTVHRYDLTDVEILEISGVRIGDNTGAEIVMHKNRPPGPTGYTPDGYTPDEDRVIEEAIRKVREETGNAVETTLAKIGTVSEAETRLDMLDIAIARRPDLQHRPDEALIAFAKSEDGQRLRKKMLSAQFNKADETVKELDSQLVSASSNLPMDQAIANLAKNEGVSFREAHRRLTEK